MTERTVESCEKTLAGIQAHNQKWLDGIRAKITERETRGHNHADLDAELDQARTIAERGEARALENLKQARELYEKKQAENTAREKANATKVDQKRKETARRAYLANGGDPADFESAWVSTIRPELLTKSVVEDVTRKDRNGVSFNSL